MPHRPLDVWPALGAALLLLMIAVTAVPAMAQDAEASAGESAEAKTAFAVADMFGDHMVLQRNCRVPVWGKAAAGSEVTVELIGNQAQKATAKADESGNWRVDLEPLNAGGPYQMQITAGQQTRQFSDVLVGEVWFCSGQSNMEWELWQTDGGEEAVAGAQDDMLRVYKVPHNATAVGASQARGPWEVAGPDAVRNFAAVGYHFGRSIREQVGEGVPVGLIESAFGGTPI